MTTKEAVIKDPLGGHLLGSPLPDESAAPGPSDSPRIDDSTDNLDAQVPEHPVQSEWSLLSELASERIPGDLVTELLLRFYGEDRAQERWVITARDVPGSVAGLMKLLQNRCFRAVVDFTGNYFEAQAEEGTKSHTAETIQVLLARIAALSYLGLHDQALRAYGLFGDIDRPEIQTILPFAFRLFYCVLPAHVGQEMVALDRLYELSANTSDQKRQSRIQYCVAWCYLRLKEYNLALSILEGIECEGPEHIEQQQYMGRVCLALGDCHQAWRHFERAEHALGAQAEETVTVHLCRGSLSLALGRHEDGYNHFARAAALSPECIAAHNNQAVASVYLGRLTEAISILNQAAAARGEPDPRVILNLATMHELESSRSNELKKELLALVANYPTDSFPADCLKLI